MKIYIDGRLMGTIPSWSERAFTLRVGEHQVKAVTAHNKTIYNRLVRIDRREELDIELGAQSRNSGGTSECSTPY